MTTIAPPSAPAPRWMLNSLLGQQQQLTAVEEFARWHDRDTPPVQDRYYRDLIPAELPGRDEQFAFEVDLDACSGCKACVTACHNLNGLEPAETWRGVGLLYGGTPQLPVIQHVTTTCHHCLDPACLEGCPVLAYEKDPTTGIVRHLDDQCIGCQYCIFKCPYDVPKYSRAKGIVRKCDMCSTRLSAGEAPACVQACPNQAIRIAVVHCQRVAEECEANLFLPGAPEPGHTLPTTVYKTARALPRNLLPADYFSAQPQHAHWPLILMLVLTQASVGAVVADQSLARLGVAALGDDLVHRGAAFLLGLLGIAAAVFHLGRPRYAYRAWIGLRTSWLSREIVAFGLFAALASLYAAAPLLSWLGIGWPRAFDSWLAAGVVATGLAGVICSAMIYASTNRPFWGLAWTLPKFLLTGAVLGLPLSLLISLLSAARSGEHHVTETFTQVGPPIVWAIVIASGAKLALEAAVFSWLRVPLFTPLKRTATLLTGELALKTIQRFFLGLVGGVALPLLLVNQSTRADGGGALFLVLLSVLVVGVGAAGELLERYLFFTAVVAPKMPGVPAG